MLRTFVFCLLLAVTLAGSSEESDESGESGEKRYRSGGRSGGSRSSYNAKRGRSGQGSFDDGAGKHDYYYAYLQKGNGRRPDVFSGVGSALPGGFSAGQGQSSGSNFQVNQGGLAGLGLGGSGSGRRSQAEFDDYLSGGFAQRRSGRGSQGRVVGNYLPDGVDGLGVGNNQGLFGDYISSGLGRGNGRNGQDRFEEYASGSFARRGSGTGSQSQLGDLIAGGRGGRGRISQDALEYASGRFTGRGSGRGSQRGLGDLLAGGMGRLCGGIPCKNEKEYVTPSGLSGIVSGLGDALKPTPLLGAITTPLLGTTKDAKKSGSNVLSGLLG